MTEPIIFLASGHYQGATPILTTHDDPVEAEGYSDPSVFQGQKFADWLYDNCRGGFVDGILEQLALRSQRTDDEVHDQWCEQFDDDEEDED